MDFHFSKGYSTKTVIKIGTISNVLRFWDIKNYYSQVIKSLVTTFEPEIEIC